MRLQKFLSQAGVASRRAAEELIRAGRVSVNDAVVSELGTRVDPERDRVHVDGRPVHARATEWLAVHKPRGYVSTRRDPQGRRTIYDLVPAAAGRLFYVGRLDVDSEGLILLTNDGDTAHRMLHPRFQVERVYEAEVSGDPDAAVLARLERGLELEDGPARAREARRIGRGRVRITLTEGKKREVRRLLAAVGHPVQRLIRVRYGSIELGALPPGQWRRLRPDEIPGAAD